jgi:hypothetical protein
VRLRSRIALLALVFAAAAGRPAAADITVTTHYTFLGGDTLTRDSYYTNKRIRVTGPDGREFMFNSKTDTVTVIDHATKRYWTGPRALADSLATRLIVANREGVPEEATADPVGWAEKLEKFNNSIKIEPAGKNKKIAGYPTNLWVLTAGDNLRSERWIARSLYIPDYGPEMQKTVLATVRDPMARALMRLMIGSRDKEGLALAGSTVVRTLDKAGAFEFEALKVKSGSIPKTAWNIPDGYTPIVL